VHRRHRAHRKLICSGSVRKTPEDETRTELRLLALLGHEFDHEVPGEQPLHNGLALEPSQ
jgi:hypothetical protein